MMRRYTATLFLVAGFFTLSVACSGAGGGGPAPSSSKALTSFAFLSPPAVGVIEEGTRSVTVTLPAGSARSALVATFGSTGAGVSIGAVAQASGVTANDFTSPVPYTVTAADRSTAAYLVTVTVCGPLTSATPGACPCSAGYGDCDGLATTGCEQQLSTDALHCGACGAPCASGVCAGGACQAARCGDGVLQPPEGCDPGTGAFTATCNTDCTWSTCGDAIVNPVAGEGCDAGGTGDTAGCLMALAAGAARCQASSCGDSYVNSVAGEGCDSSGLDIASCNGQRCTVATCGDGYANQAADEQCDSGGVDTASCNAGSCKMPACGDAYLNLPTGETCDDGGTLDTAACNMSGASTWRRCQLASCGDGYRNVVAGEDCDPGGFDTATCNGLSCRSPSCGDGYVNLPANESCDLGADNGTPSACCDRFCRLAAGSTSCP